MNLRSLTVFALVLALGAIVAWVWFAMERTPAANPAVPEASPSRLTAGNSRTGQPTAGAASPAREAAAPEPKTPAITPIQPVQMTSSVSPGMPLVRTTPAPSVVAATRASASRPESQADVKADLEGVQFMLRDFRTRMGGNPVGSNAEIMHAVMGGNEVRANLGPPTGQQVNEMGELVDRWGTPYFFHQLSGKSMEVRSAGPDRRLWTADDTVAK